ncbi:MAG TPA: GAF domain-containing sensor histidine kinase [Solirubrobacteraceae bacterium]|nr:GAF domain-containing sensor histidine kinase [Solirubrobacteraceae bacterium]
MRVDRQADRESRGSDEFGILAVAQGVMEQLSVDQVLDRVVRAARDLTGARYAALGVLDPARTRLERFITVGMDDRTREQVGPLPSGRGVLGELIRNPRPLRLDDVGGHPSSYGFPAGHPPMHSFLGVPVFVAGAPFGNLYLTEKPEGSFSAHDEEAVITLATFAGVAIDHARRYAATEERRDQLEETVRALDATLQIARALSGETELPRILTLVAQRSRALVGARSLLIERLRGEEIEIAQVDGEVSADLVGRSFPLADTVAEAALVSGETQDLSAPLTRLRFARHGAGRLGLTAEEGLFVPLIFRGRRYGVLIVLGSLRGGFDANERQLLESFASSVAIAVATAATAADERRRQALAAAEAERARWARELHDETLQALGNLRLVLSGARRMEDPERLRAAVDEALEQLGVDISSLRSLITELRPAALDQLGLGAALLALMDRVRQTGLEVEDRIGLAREREATPDRLVEEQETAIYRIVQEALTNIAKHAGASHVRVEVVEDDSTVHVRVIDDGVGFEETRQSEGFGLEGIRERVELLGGELRIISAPGQGTEIEVKIAARHRQPDDPRADADAPGLAAGSDLRGAH